MLPINLSASTINGTKVVNTDGNDLGNIKEIMIDINNGRIAYIVLSFGGFLGLGDKYFAMPWEAFAIDTENRHFILHVPKIKLENAPGFEKDDWPDNADDSYLTAVYNHYGYQPYWDLVKKDDNQ